MEKYLARCIEDGECLIWTGALASDGYPRIAKDGNSNVKLHRLVAEWFHGESAEGKVVRHKCDNPKCIQPKHLLIGSHGENMFDRSIRDRHQEAKITVVEVKQIKDLLSCRLFLQREIADAYGIDQRTVSSIHKGKHWKCVH